ncbi:MAG: SGNH/GDSL hydrolase family protein [Pseudonocardia sp.]|nr:SGNH/GDSL hydrolase family protein [Pseudonocardia sp.]
MFDVLSRLRSVIRTVGLVSVLTASATAVFAPTAVAEEVAPDQYVALGDSFSSGNGTFRADLSPAFVCYRSSFAYPALVAEQRPNTELDFRACQGARTSNVVNSQVKALDAGTDFVSLTIGGNDIGFVDLILACGSAKSPNCFAAVDTSNARIRDELPAKLDQAYAAISAAAPNVREVVVLGYGRFFGPNLACPTAFGFTGAEATRLNGVADNLDAMISARVSAAGFEYRSAIPGFAGHDVCASDPYLNGINLRLTDSFHPTRRGHSEVYARQVRSVIG